MRAGLVSLCLVGLLPVLAMSQAAASDYRLFEISAAGLLQGPVRAPDGAIGHIAVVPPIPAAPVSTARGPAQEAVFLGCDGRRVPWTREGLAPAKAGCPASSDWAAWAVAVPMESLQATSGEEFDAWFGDTELWVTEPAARAARSLRESLPADQIQGLLWIGDLFPDLSDTLWIVQAP